MDAAGRTLPFVLSSSKNGKPLPAEVKGSILECTYVVEISAKIDWIPLLGIEVPIHIYHSSSLPSSASLPEAYHHEPLALPPTANAVDWNPTMEEEVNIPMATAVTAEKGGAAVGGVVPSAPSMRWGGFGKSGEL